MLPSEAVLLNAYCKSCASVCEDGGSFVSVYTVQFGETSRIREPHLCLSYMRQSINAESIGAELAPVTMRWVGWESVGPDRGLW